MLAFYCIQPVQSKVPTSAQRRRPSSSAMKQDATILANTNDLTKEEQMHRITSSKTRHGQINGSQEKIENMPLQTPSNNEEQDKPITNSYTKETEKNGTEDSAQQQSVERSDQLMSEVAGSQAEATEMT